MKIRFKKLVPHDPERMMGMKVHYAPGKRPQPRLRWYLLLAVVSLPVIWLCSVIFKDTFFVRAKGYVTPDVFEVRAAHEGMIQKVNVVVGEEVGQNQCLVQLVSSDLIQKCDKVMASLTVVEDVEKMRAEEAGHEKIRLQKEYEAVLEQVEIRKKQYRSMQFLKEEGAATVAEEAKAQSDWMIASENLERVHAVLEKAKDAEIGRLSRVDLEEKVLLMHQLYLLRKESKQLDHLAPANGKILDIYVTPGENVSFAAPLLAMSMEDIPHVSVYLSPKHIAYAVAGQKATLTFQDGSHFEGEVLKTGKFTKHIPAEYVGPLEIRSLALVVKLKFSTPVPQEKLISGLPVSVRFRKRIPWI